MGSGALMAFTMDKGEELGEELLCVVPGQDPPSPTPKPWAQLQLSQAPGDAKELQICSTLTQLRPEKSCHSEGLPPRLPITLFILTI